MKRIFITLVLMLFLPALLWADLVPLTDVQLQLSVGKIDFSPAETSPEVAQAPTANTLSPDDLTLTEGIELDIKIQASLDVTYVDPDGIGENGSEGMIELSGLHIGGSDAPITAEMLASDTPFASDELAIINNVLIEVDPHEGMFITIEEFGDNQGNGVDIIINDIFLGDRTRSAGGLLIENLSNFIQDKNVTRFNSLFGMNLATVDDGKNTENGNWAPFLTQVVTESADDVLANQADTALTESLNQVSAGVGLPGFGSNTTIDASFVLHMDKVAWVDDGGEFGLAGLMVYQGEDTNGDGIDDTIGPARLTQMKLETITHTNLEGESVQALYIENLDFKADIAIQSIYVGSPANSLGALHIKGLDTSGTSIWIYGH
ncbi:MAG: hypothetical protein V7785_03285 [Bermanella sp.]